MLECAKDPKKIIFMSIKVENKLLIRILKDKLKQIRNDQTKEF